MNGVDIKQLKQEIDDLLKALAFRVSSEVSGLNGDH
jgi:hypothetical protein